MTGKNITLMADFSGATATIMTAEGENEARVYRFTVVDVGGAVINLESEGANVALYIMRPGAPVQIGAEINGSTATITIPSGACSVPGKFAAWLQIVTSTYDLRVDGMEFVVKANAIDDGAEQAEAEFGLLTEMIQQGQAAIEKMESYFPTSIENGGTGATTAEAARENLGIPLPLSVEKGGTGATTAEAARENLGIPLPLSVEKGGTGATTAEAARENLGIPLPLSVEKGGTGATTAEAARKNLELEYGKSDTCNFGAYYVTGLITGGGESFFCTIMLPNPLDTSISQINVSGKIRIRQNGNYLVGSPSSDVSLSTMDVTCELCNNRQAFTLTISGNFASVVNNETASLHINDFVISWS